MYHVISVYYKHGESVREIFNTFEELYDYAFEQYVEYFDEESLDVSLAITPELTFEQLVKRMIKLGDYIISHQRGYGVQHVIQS